MCGQKDNVKKGKDDKDNKIFATQQEALAAEIAQVRLEGEIEALYEKITGLRYQLTIVFENIIENNRYVGLEKAMTRANNILIQMRVYFAELKKLDPAQK